MANMIMIISAVCDVARHFNDNTVEKNNVINKLVK